MYELLDYEEYDDGYEQCVIMRLKIMDEAEKAARNCYILVERVPADMKPLALLDLLAQIGLLNFAPSSPTRIVSHRSTQGDTKHETDTRDYQID